MTDVVVLLDGPQTMTFKALQIGSREPAQRYAKETNAISPRRRYGYTTNAIENINSQLRKIIKTRGHFPTDEAATKLIWLALRNITADWGRAAHDWKAAMN